MNKKLSIISTIVALLVVFGWTNIARAEGLGSAVGNCDTVTFTTAPGTRMILGVDADPPGELNDANGLTATVELFPYFEAHAWTWVVIQDGTIVDRGHGTVENCLATPYPVDDPMNVHNPLKQEHAADTDIGVVRHTPEFTQRFGPF